jgi:hypothetical protein
LLNANHKKKVLIAKQRKEEGMNEKIEERD